MYHGVVCFTRQLTWWYAVYCGYTQFLKVVYHVYSEMFREVFSTSHKLFHLMLCVPVLFLVVGVNVTLTVATNSHQLKRDYHSILLTV